MSYTINKLKVKKGLPEVHFSLNKSGITSIHQVSINGLVHNDLSELLQKLKAHMCLITELVNPVFLGGIDAVRDLLNKNELHVHEAFSGFNCTGFSISSDGVVLIGNRTLSTNKVLNITAPYTLMTEDSDYSFATHLYSQVQDAIEEVVLLLEGKMSGEQLDLFAEMEEAA